MHTQLWQLRLVVSFLVVLSGILGLPRHSPAHGVEFTCAAGDVACLIDAVNQANANGQANTITLEAGTYPLTEVNNTTDGPNGLPSVIGVLTLQGAGPDTTIIEREANAPPFRLVHVAVTGTLTLDGLTLRAGSGASVTGIDGGGLFNRGTLSLSRTIVADIRAIGTGGLLNRGGTVTMATTKVINNLAGFESGGVLNVSGTLLITDTTFAGNASQGSGGLTNQGGTVILTNSTFMDNGGDAGGGLSNRNGTVVLTNSTIAHNASVRRGNAGGLQNFPGGTVVLTNSTVADNRSERGGGLQNAGGTVVLMNTILARNQLISTGGTGPDCAGPVTSLGTNLVGDPTGCTITLLPTDLTGDPGLGDFTDDGTPGNGHFPLLPGSQAIDAGNDAFCLPTDQLGEPRVGRCDIGAIEFQGKHHKQH
jgi:hypothetical protein